MLGYYPTNFYEFSVFLNGIKYAGIALDPLPPQAHKYVNSPKVIINSKTLHFRCIPCIPSLRNCNTNTK